MRRAGCMRMAYHTGILAVSILLSVGCGQQKGAGAPSGEATAAVQEQGGVETGTAGETALSDQPSQQAVPAPPQPAQADQLGQPPQTVQGEEQAVPAAPASQEQAGGSKADGTVSPDGPAGPDGSISPGSPAGSGDSARAGSGAFTAKEAEEKALAHAGLTAEQVTYIRSKADYEKGRPVYEVEFYAQDGKEYDYEIDGDTGEVIGFDYEAEGYAPSAVPDGSGLTAEEAKALALANVPGAADADIREFEMDHDDGRTEYEGKIIYGGMEYEFEIDGLSGMIRSWEVEPAGR